MTTHELQIFRTMESDPKKMCITSDGHQAYLHMAGGGMQCIYSGGRDINELSTEDFIAFVYDASIED